MKKITAIIFLTLVLCFISFASTSHALWLPQAPNDILDVITTYPYENPGPE